MPDWYEIAQKVQYGNGKLANVLGQPWTVYRTKNTSTGDLLDAANIYLPNVPCFFEVNTPTLKKSMMGEKIPGVILYELSLDTIEYQLKVGDVFICADSVFSAGYTKIDWTTTDIDGFVLAQNAPNKLTIGVRLNKTCKILRQNVLPVDGSWGPDSTNCDVLSLNNGVYSFVPQDDEDRSPCVFPIGVFPVARPYGDKAILDAPAMQRKSGWAGYLPPIKGVQLRATDRVHMADGTKYQVIIAASQETGMVGNYVFLEQETV